MAQTPNTHSIFIVGVTGAAGYLASHVIRKLVSRGYQVRGTVRDKSDTAKIGHLMQMHNIELFEADLLEEGSFDECFCACDGIIHCASPVLLNTDDPEQQLVEPAVNGTLNVLQTALRHKSIKRVVLTSSLAAITSGKQPEDLLHRYNEQDWNLQSTIKDSPYRYSKRLAEEAAWNFMKDHKEEIHFDLVVLNPSFMLGPPMSTRTDSTSVTMMKGMLEGQYKDGANAVCPGCVDVRDVALAHVLALEHPEATGQRFILSSHAGISHLELAKKLASSTDFATFPLPTTEKAPIAYRPLIDRTKSEKILGLNYTPIEETVIDMASWLVDNGIVQEQRIGG